MIKNQGVLEDSQIFAGGCGCLYCCAGEDLQQERYEALLYEQALISNFADAVIPDPSNSTLTVTTQRDENLRSLGEEGVAPVPLAAAQGDEVIPAASVQTLEAQALPGGDAIPLVAVQQDSAIAFTNVTRSASLQLPTQTWGSAVGDYDGDGFVDIWLNRHQLPPILYRNQGDGTFRNVTNTAFPVDGDIRGDFHGSAFVDIDNDGDQDLLQLAGGDQGEEDDNPNKESKLFINTNGQFRAEECGVAITIPSNSCFSNISWVALVI